MAILGNHEVNALRFTPSGSDVPIEAPDCVQYPSDAPVTFFGHYALKDASPGRSPIIWPVSTTASGREAFCAPTLGW